MEVKMYRSLYNGKETRQDEYKPEKIYMFQYILD